MWTCDPRRELGNAGDVGAQDFGPETHGGKHTVARQSRMGLEELLDGLAGGGRGRAVRPGSTTSSPSVDAGVEQSLSTDLVA